MNFSNASGTFNGTTSIPLFQPAAQDRWIRALNFFIVVTNVATAIISLVGNFVVVYAFIAYKKLRASVTNYFVISLAISDILTSAFVITFKLDQTLKYHQWTHGEFMCSLYTTMYLLAVPSSVINLCAVTVDRYLVLRMPLRYNSVMPPGRAVFILCCLWAYALIWACLPAMGWRINLPILENDLCYFVTTRSYNVTVNIVNFILPMIFMALFWSLIYAIVLKHRERVFEMERNLSFNTCETIESTRTTSSNTLESQTASSSHLAPKVNKERKKLRRNFRRSRYLGFIVVLFYFCWLPYVTISMIGNLCTWCMLQNLIPYELYDAFLALGFMNSALNPFLYPFHDKHFKEAFRDMWRKVRSRTFELLPRKEKVFEMARMDIAVTRAVFNQTS